MKIALLRAIESLAQGGRVLVPLILLSLAGFAIGFRGLLTRRKEELPALRRSMSLLATLASLAPLLGLLGTVFGLVHTFEGLGTGSADPSAVGGGISEALVATEAGLLVAIPLVLLYDRVRARAERLASEAARG
jgi:biopolymer transport protein ExbB/TolQ